MDHIKNRKMINFDLDQAKLKQFYPGKDHTYAYRQIGMFLKKNGFEHSQGSGYVSKEPLYQFDIDRLVVELIYKYNWLSECIKEFSSTNIDKYTDLMGTVKSAECLLKKQKQINKDKQIQR